MTISFLNGELQEAVENLNKRELTQEEKWFERLGPLAEKIGNVRNIALNDFVT